jgi:hypothetical protein
MPSMFVDLPDSSRTSCHDQNPQFGVLCELFKYLFPLCCGTLAIYAPEVYQSFV